MKKAFLFISITCLGILLAAHHIAYAAADNKSLPGAKHLLSGEVKDGIRTIKVNAAKYKFLPDPIVVKSGERVRLVITSADVAHGLAISEFKVNVSVPAGKTETVEFIAGKEGIFHVYCSVFCGLGHGNMRGIFMVEK